MRLQIAASWKPLPQQAFKKTYNGHKTQAKQSKLLCTAVRFTLCVTCLTDTDTPLSGMHHPDKRQPKVSNMCLRLLDPVYWNLLGDATHKLKYSIEVLYMEKLGIDVKFII